jgi:hypothetical protein
MGGLEGGSSAFSIKGFFVRRIDMISEIRCYAYCREDLSLIENYDKAVADTTQIWRCHHRLEIQDEGKTIYSVKQLQEMGLYYNRPASELIFLTLSEHNKLHAKYLSEEQKFRRASAMKGRILTKEHRLHLSQALKGRKMSEKELEAHRRGSEKLKGRHISEETRLKLLEARKKIKYTDEMRKVVSERFKGVLKSEETKQKMSESAKRKMSEPNEKLKRSISIKYSEKYRQSMAKRKGERWWNNGVICVRSLECPDGFVLGRLPYSEEHKKKLSDALKGRPSPNKGHKASL